MQTSNIMAFAKSSNPLKAQNFKPSTDRNFQDLLDGKLSKKEPLRRQEQSRDYEKLQKNAKEVEPNSKDQKKLEDSDEKVKKSKKEISEASLKELESLLSEEEIENLENPEELEALMEKISELGEEMQLILGKLMEQGVIDESLMEKVEALVDLDISFDGDVEEASKMMEKLSKLLQGIQEITDKTANSTEDPKALENLIKAQEEMNALIKEAMEKASMVKNGLTESSLKDQPQQVKSENETLEKKENAKAVNTEKVTEENATLKNADAKETAQVKEKPVQEEVSLREKASAKEKDLAKEEKSSKVSVTVETKEEPVLERNFLFNQGKMESLDKLSTILTKNPSGFEQNLSQMIEEMTEKISIMKNGEASAIKMQLVPNNLGKLVIELSTDENILSAKVYADTPKVKEMIENQLEELKEALIDKGLTVESLEVFVGQEQDRALYQKHGPMMMTGQNRSAQISFSEMEALEEAALKTNPYVEKYQYNRLV